MGICGGPTSTVHVFIYLFILKNSVFVPSGFVDAHTHPVWAGDRVHEFAMKVRTALIGNPGFIFCEGARRSSVVQGPLVKRWVIGSIPLSGFTELFFVPPSSPKLM